MKLWRIRKNRVIGYLSSAVMFFIAAVYLVSLSYFLPLHIEEMIEYGKGDPIEIIIEPGQNAREIAGSISSHGLTDRPGDLARWFGKIGIDRTLKPGLYRIRPGSAWEIAKQMEFSVPEVASLTILPGDTFHDLIEKFGEPLQKALEDEGLFPEKLRAILPDKTSSRIAYILPDTYSVSPSLISFRELVKSASSAWWKRIGSTMTDRSGKVSDHIFRKSILASMVEKEAVFDEERAIIAGVIENRDRIGMRLQIDSTVVYAWSLRGTNLNRVLYDHLEIDSPYNTYVHKGFPPGPICVPSVESWQAAIEPEKVPYFYYVARPDGKHIFSVTYTEHLKAIRTVREKIFNGTD